jgi:hypothetical protein
VVERALVRLVERGSGLGLALEAGLPFVRKGIQYNAACVHVALRRLDDVMASLEAAAPCGINRH